MEMVKFELEVLSNARFSELYLLRDKLEKSKNYLTEAKELARTIGDFKSAIDCETKLIRVSENLDTIGVAMLSKEADLFDLFTDIEPIGLN